MRSKIKNQKKINHSFPNDSIAAVVKIISSYIKAENQLSGSLGETLIRDLFNSSFDHQADCDQFSFACITLLKAFSNDEFSNLIGPAKDHVIRMLTQLITFFEHLQDADSQAYLDQAYLLQSFDSDYAFRLKRDYTIKLKLKKFENQLEAQLN